MTATIHGPAHARALAAKLCESPVRVGEWVLAQGREARVLDVKRTGVGSIAIRVAFGNDETWLSPLHIQKLD